MAYSQQGNMTQSNYIVNLIELQNTINSASGLSPLQQLQTEVNAIQTMVNFDQKRIFTNIISKYDQSPIQVTDDINLSNATIYQNGSVFSGGGGSGGATISSASTLILGIGGISPFININSNGIYFQTGITPDPAMFISTSGNVGIKTVSPQYDLDVAGTINTFSCISKITSSVIMNSGSLSLGIYFI